MILLAFLATAALAADAPKVQEVGLHDPVHLAPGDRVALKNSTFAVTFRGYEKKKAVLVDDTCAHPIPPECTENAPYVASILREKPGSPILVEIVTRVDVCEALRKQKDGAKAADACLERFAIATHNPEVCRRMKSGAIPCLKSIEAVPATPAPAVHSDVPR